MLPSLVKEIGPILKSCNGSPSTVHIALFKNIEKGEAYYLVEEFSVSVESDVPL